MIIRKLTTDDAEAFVKVRRRGLEEVPLAFGASPEDDRFRTPDAFRELMGIGDDNVVFGAFDPDLVGVVGIYRDHHVKARHKMHIWGMYVAPEARQRGVGRKLIDAAIEHARHAPDVEWVNLGVSSTTPAAQALYEGAGFQQWGTEPDALRDGDESGDEIWMILKL